MKRTDTKSRCPFNFTMEIIGNPWSVLILRDMVALGKKTFSEFLSSEERIGTSVLAERLADLEKRGVITKHVDENDARRHVYSLTPTGLEMLPVLYEIAVWGSHTSPHPKAHEYWFTSMNYDRGLVLKLWRDALESGSCFFFGPKSVVRGLRIEK